MRTLCPLALAFSLALSVAATAQERTPSRFTPRLLSPGIAELDSKLSSASGVRVRLRDTTFVGVRGSFVAGRLILWPALLGAAADTIPIAAIQTIEKRHSEGLAMAIGFGAGAGVVGFLAQFLLDSRVEGTLCSGGQPFCLPGVSASLGDTNRALRTGVISAGIGALVGWILGDKVFPEWRIVF